MTEAADQPVSTASDIICAYYLDGSGPASQGELVAMLTEFQTNRINDVVDSIDDELTEVETDLGNQNIRQIQQRLSAIRKQAATAITGVIITAGQA